MATPKTRADRPAVEPVWDAGFHLLGTVLRLDARRASELSFVSHAHRRVRHSRIICTDRTLRLLSARTVPGHAVRPGALPVAFGRPLNIGPLRLELVPAGHVLGSAQLLVETSSARMVYCAGFQPYGSLTAEKYQVRPCDVLALDCPYDAPGVLFPPPAQVRASILEWVFETLALGHTPVLLGSTLGKGQELLKLLGDHDLEVRAHQSIYEIGRVYRELGVALKGARSLRGQPRSGEVLVFPLRLSSSPMLRRLRGVRIALVSGRALDPAEVARAHVDVSFPLSDHSDHAGLVQLVRATGAKHVVLSPRHSAAFERVIKRRGVRITRFSVPEQLSLLAPQPKSWSLP